jgi:protein-L-isoaspartate(D-aspartate) O-methyltransferase
MSRLINDLIRNGYLKTDAIIEAFSEIERVEFVPKDLEIASNINIPLPIGFGQTIPQPLTMAFMLELLDPGKGNHILDVGSGSGWSTALLAHIVGEKGRVTAMEIIEKLCEVGKKNVDKFGYIKKGIVEIHCMNAQDGWEKNAPYDRIFVSAVLEEIPISFKNQLAVGGKMVVPIRNAIIYLEKRGEFDFYKETFSGFSFVPFITKSKK